MGALERPSIGVVTGLMVEARILQPLADQGLIRLGVAGADAARATALAERFADEGVGGLMSFGICGGLLSSVQVGDLVLPDSVIHPAGPTVATDPAWRRALTAGLAARARRIALRSGALVGSATLVEHPADKAALAAQHEAVAVDMESHAVAQVAAERRLPLLVVRTCSDAADRSFPIAALEAMSPDGSFRIGPVAKAVARKPWVVPPLIRLALETRQALACLKRIARCEAELLRRG